MIGLTKILGEHLKSVSQSINKFALKARTHIQGVNESMDIIVLMTIGTTLCPRSHHIQEDKI